MKEANFDVEGITCNNLVVNNEYGDIGISCICKKSNRDIKYCAKSFLRFDPAHDEAYVCSSVTSITDMGLPVCSRNPDDDFYQDQILHPFKSFGKQKYVAPELTTGIELKFEKQGALNVYSLMPDHCRLDNPCLQFIVSMLNHKLTTYDDTQLPLLRYCEGLGTSHFLDRIGCCERGNIMESLIK